MAFLNQARGIHEMDLARTVIDSARSAGLRSPDGGLVPMISVSVRFRHGGMSWEEVPVVVAASALPQMYQLAEGYHNAKEHPTLHVDAKTADPHVTKRVHFKNDRSVVIEIVASPWNPPQTDEDIRRRTLRGRGGLPIPPPSTWNEDRA